MHLFDRLLFQPVRSSNATDIAPLIDEVVQQLPKVRVTYDDVARLYWQSERDIWHERHDFGPMRPPFDLMWMEARQPRRVHAGGEWHSSTENLTYGSIVSSATVGEIVQVNIEYIVHVRGLLPAILPFSTRAEVSYEGAYLRRVVAGAEDWLTQVPEERMDEAQQYLAAMEQDAFKPVALALSLMNCQNVKLEDETPPERLSKRHRRETGKPLVTTTRITLPSAARSAATTSEAREIVGGPQPLHLVRGHFKTYTPDKPLFGREIGTWWWGWQARGNVKAGERRHTYGVIPPERFEDE